MWSTRLLHQLQHAIALSVYCRMLNVREHLSWRFGNVWRSRFLNLASVTFGVLFSYASIIFGKFYFGESKEPRETRVIKFARKLSILQYQDVVQKRPSTDKEQNKAKGSVNIPVACVHISWYQSSRIFFYGWSLHAYQLVTTVVWDTKLSLSSPIWHCHVSTLCEYNCRIWRRMSFLRPGIVKQHKTPNSILCLSTRLSRHRMTNPTLEGK